ncbi:hypothetical protein Rru_A2260 [Rhodospirillum rubrum ATCC 11170]|uniref:DUF3618 domain-containing protein n=1 Tax=Rhodospirillum rubrum (strain ATCC 11170 / ATH 1.1.1 / DSM 467 / LMG 4362 / NCIMB 8255 / S1) TaxID=269796 RepID=Q2RS35_RHORT|nr:hypothetical protein [Rhodospirillum rubrum]ABC23060.1 hypothetical protein Rru_A2260 [Rhodospirillum rubrum ATCC 11170]MBK5954687.1 hypothetical protein [Rhodospirillum rubrum]HCF17504.1 hypothetical protein [Rhodospirillum rubrum]
MTVHRPIDETFSADPQTERRADAFSERVGAGTGGLIDEAKTMAIGLAEREKRRLADNIALRARAIRQAAQPFRVTDPVLAEGIESVAETLDATADHIGLEDMDDLVEEVSDVVRRQPVLVIGAAALLGLAAGRFLRAAFDDPETPRRPAKASATTPPPPPGGYADWDDEGTLP